MSGIQRILGMTKTNPVAVYIGGGVLLHLLRSFAVNAAYQKHFTQFDVDRQRELEQHLATHNPNK